MSSLFLWLRLQLGETRRALPPSEILQLIYRPSANRRVGVYALMHQEAGGDKLLEHILWLYEHFGGIGELKPFRLRNYSSIHVSKPFIINCLDKELKNLIVVNNTVVLNEMKYHYIADELEGNSQDEDTLRLVVLAMTRLRLGPL